LQLTNELKLNFSKLPMRLQGSVSQQAQQDFASLDKHDWQR
jgi:hypothetical protein